MNCKPGDLAVVIRNSTVDDTLMGRLVRVLHAAPMGDYVLPDGMAAYNQHADRSWVCESLGAPFIAPLLGSWRRTRLARYAGIADWGLRPIRGDESPETIVRELETQS